MILGFLRFSAFLAENYKCLTVSNLGGLFWGLLTFCTQFILFLPGYLSKLGFLIVFFGV